MSKLDELIKELCPNGVEYKSFGDVAKIQRGASPRPIAKYITDDENGVSWIKIGDTIPNSKYVNWTEQKITVEGATKSRLLKKGDFIMSNSMSFGRPYILNIDGAIHDGWASISDFANELNPDFLYHFLSSNLVQNYWLSKINSGSVSNLNSDIIKSLSIPLPPLPVQREIARILDNFTELTAELTAELTDRKKQYEFYRDSLLLNNNKHNRVTLKSVVKKSCSGGTPKKDNSKFYLNGTVPWLRTQDVKFNEIYKIDSFITEEAVKKTSAKWIPENCVIVAISGATAGRCAVNKIPTTTNQHCYNMEIDETKALYKYVYYCVCSQYEELLSKKQGARGDLNSTLILGTEIPIPYPNDRVKSLAEQKRIVDILDRFDTLCNDISKGLPAEIDERQKQYEYYRDKLLTFPRAKLEV